MTPERWQQVQRLYQSALGQEPSKRADFLKKACTGDEELRREVESLLAQDQPESFIDASALEVAVQEIAADQSQSLVGRQIGTYKVLSLLGVGGMGEVYLASDTRLGRKITLKILPRGLPRIRIGFGALSGGQGGLSPQSPERSNDSRNRRI